MYYIVKQGTDDCFLWKLPDLKRVWATEAEFQKFCREHRENGILMSAAESGRVSFMREEELRKGSTREFCAEEAADYVSRFSDGRLVQMPPEDRERIKRAARQERIVINIALIFLGAWLLAVASAIERSIAH